MSPKAVAFVGETTLSELKTRPDFSVTVGNALVGHIEIKAPGKGADPRKFTDPHDKEQWEKLKSLPNLIYTDGNSFSLWRDGKLQGSIVHLDGDVEASGAKLAAPAALLPLVVDFLQWSPIPPKTAKQLAQVSARLCRLLRDEVVEQMAVGSPALTGLAHDWRCVTLPASRRCTVCRRLCTGGDLRLLVARARDISFVGRHPNGGAGAEKIELADWNRAQTADRRYFKSGGVENFARHAHARARCRQLAHDYKG